jgi:hypothetical protein
MFSKLVLKITETFILEYLVPKDFPNSRLYFHNKKFRTTSESFKKPVYWEIWHQKFPKLQTLFDIKLSNTQNTLPFLFFPLLFNLTLFDMLRCYSFFSFLFLYCLNYWFEVDAFCCLREKEKHLICVYINFLWVCIFHRSIFLFLESWINFYFYSIFVSS